MPDQYPPMPVIVQGDARALQLPDESVDLVVTSPPYWSLRSYQDGGDHYEGQIGDEETAPAFIAALIDCTREWTRVLKPSGSIFVNLGDKYTGSGMGGNGGGRVNGRVGQGVLAGGYRRRKTGMPNKSLMLLPERYRIAALDELGLVVREVLIWHKPHGVPDNAVDRAARRHEDWVHLTKQGRYHYNPETRYASSVWTVATQPLNVPAELGIHHHAAFPMELPRRLILGWSPVDGTVLDPFGGTGTTALVATMLGRRGISVDLSADYARLAQWRASDPKQRAKAAGTKPPTPRKPPPPNQEDLFGVRSA